MIANPIVVSHRNALVDKVAPGHDRSPPRAPKRTSGTSSGRPSTRVVSLTMNTPDETFVALPPVVEGLLLDLVADGFVLYCCGDRAAPTALAASYDWEHYIDLVTIRDFDRITTARVPKRGKVDIFAPEVVVWAYEGPPQYALRTLLDLAHPAHPDAPTTEYPAPPSLHIPRAQQRPMTIRPPSASRARARATRLATAMTTHSGAVTTAP